MSEPEVTTYRPPARGPQIMDNRRESFRLSRQGAIALRDSLTAAIEWRADA